MGNIGTMPDGDRDPAFQAAFERARGRFAGVALSADELWEALARAGNPDLEKLHVEDVFLAAACSKRDARALAIFEESVIPHARAALMARKERPDEVEEVLQQLRERLFVGGKIAEYSGAGPLASWTRMVAVRTALNAKRGAGREVGDDGVLEQMVAPAIAPEFGFVKTHYRGDFKACFESAFQALPERSRSMLRLNLLEGLTTTQLARMYRVDGSTVRRWIADAREHLLTETRRLLRERLHLQESELESLIGLLLTQLDDSVRRILKEDAP